MAASCQAATPTQPTASGTPSAVATAYLDNLIELMRTNSINRLTIDWPAFRNEVFREAGASQTIAELNRAIRLAITMLRDGHSSYRSATGTTIFVARRSCAAAPPVPLTTPSNIATVRVTSFGGAGAAATAFANQIQEAIAAADRDDLIGWIVDLRSNGGGNMWPMIAGVGPLLGGNPVGWFVRPTGTREPWAYEGGASLYNNGPPLARISGTGYVPRDPAAPVAVLTGSRTMSAGEAVAVAFRGRPNTRSFGAPTGGMSTANESFELGDGGRLVITTSVYADRTGRRYGKAIAPDVTLTAGLREALSPNDAIASAARSWIESQPACAR
jgi:C-terminal processing protease CtpA/Prc